MKRSGCERSASTPASRYYAGTHTNTAQINPEPEPGADDTRPPEQQAAAGQTPAATLQPMPFPGPFAYTPIPAVVGHDGARTGAVTSTSTSVDEPGENTHGFSPLIAAVKRGDLNEVNALIQSGSTDVNQLDEKCGASALIFAADQGSVEVVAALLASGAQVNLARAKNGHTALISAAVNGHAEVVRMLLKHPGIAVDQPNGLGSTALMLAAFNNKPDVVACLLAAGAQINLAHAKPGNTALTFAAGKGHAEVVRMLLKHPGIAVDQPNGVGITALMLAASNNKPDVVACLLAAGAQVNLADAKSGNTALISPAKLGHAEVVRMLLKHPGIAVDQPNGFGATALMFAALNNKPDVVACLLAAGAQINRANAKSGETALTVAAANGHAEVVRMLLKHPGIAVDQPNGFGNTALMRAAFSNKPEVVACLLAAGAQVNLAHADNGSTALIVATEYGYAEVVRTLLKHPGIAVDHQDVVGDTALMLAAKKNKPEVVACLLAAGASMNLVHRNGYTPLSFAVDQAHAATIEIFLLHGIQLDGQGPDFFQSEPTPDRVAIADLCADRDMPAPELLAPVQAPAFFRELISTLRQDGATKPLMRWLRGKGIRMACAQQMAAAVSGAHAAWRLQPGGVKPANAQQQMVYFLSALGRLGTQGGTGKVLELYQASGISAAAIERLGGTACRQLDNLARLALEVAAQVGGDMLNSLVDTCLALTGLECTVDADALKARLLHDGYCAPLAEAIALAWKNAVAQLQEQRSVIPDGLTLGQVTQFVHKQIVARAPARFALAILEQLDSRDRLTSLRSMMDGSNDEGLHALFQLQCDQLRQYCAQLLEVANPETLQASNN